MPSSLRRLVVAATALSLGLAIAPGAPAAQPSNSPLNTPAGAGTAAPVPAPAESASGASGSHKSPGTALALSLGGTVASFALAGIGAGAENGPMQTVGTVGMWIAPSFGHWYVGKGWTRGLKWRLAGAGAVGIGVMWFAVDCIPGCSEGAIHPGALLAIGGTVAFFGGMVHDIATAPGAAREHNARIEGRIQNVTVLPSIGGGHTGLAISGRF